MFFKKLSSKPGECSSLLPGLLRYVTAVVICAGLLGVLPGEGQRAGGMAIVHADSDPSIAAAGDIACDPLNRDFNGGNGTAANCRQKYTADLLVNGNYAAVLPLGDIQYYCGGYEAFQKSYELSWGRVKDISRPVVGNHEYLHDPDPNASSTGCDITNDKAAGYFKYFGAAAGDPAQGYYSYNIGAWHLIALNSNCGDAGGCGPLSPQGQWLLRDLAESPRVCTLAYWHIPLFSSGGRAENNSRDLWQILYDHNVDVILNGHDHIYERFVPQRPDGAADLIRGMRQFTVGTGGANFTFLKSLAANSEVLNLDTYGVLKLTLHPTTYDWQFVPEAGKTFSDTGTGYCSGAGIQDSIPPTAASNLKASFVSGNEVHLTWTRGTDNTAVAGYQIFRNGVYIGAATEPHYVDLTTQSGTSYTYSVTTMDVAELTSDPSNTVTVIPVGFFNDDFESNTLARWTAVTSMTIQQQEVFAGSYAARAISTGQSAVAYKQLSEKQNELYYRIHFKIMSQAQPVNLLKFRTQNASSSTSILGVYVSGTGYLGIRNDILQQSTPSAVFVSKGDWHELQVRLLVNDSAGQTDVWLDGSPIDVLSRTESFGASPIGRLQLGENALNTSFDVVFDNVTVDTQLIPSDSTPIYTSTPTSTGTTPFTNTPTGTATPTASQTHTPTPVSQGSILFTDGFETGSLSQWTSSQQLVVQSQHVASGNYAAQGTSLGGAATYARKSLATPQTDLSYRLRFKLIGQPTTTVNLLKFRTAANGSILSFSVNNKVQLAYRNDIALQSKNSSVSVSLGVWHTLLVRVRIADTAGQIEVWYDDMPVTSLTRTEAFGTNPIGILQLGENTSGLTYDIAFDDVVLSTGAGPITPTFTPTATATAFQTSTPSTTFTPTATGTPTPTASATSSPTQTSGASGNFTFLPVADAYVYSVNPTTNFGTLTTLRVDASPDMRSYLRFTLQGLSGSVRRATLRIFANSASTSGISIQAVSDTPWIESGINYNNAPPLGNVIGSFSPVVGGVWINIDVTSYITGNGTYDLALTTPGSTAISLASRQAGANAPQLIVETFP